MNRLFCLGFIALAVGVAHGGVMREDDMMGMVSNMIASPDAFATSLGMDRVKRSAWDKEFNLEKKGFSFKIKYNDPSNKAKGGVAEIYFKDFREFMRSVPVKSVKFNVKFDSKAKFGDMLFDFDVDYELGFLFGGMDTGKVKFERKQEGAFYNTQVDFMSNSENNPDRPPTVQVNMKSDYRTRAEGRFFFNNHKDQPKEYNFEVDYVNKESFKGVFRGEKTYTFEGQYNNAEKRMDLVVDLDGKKYNGFADVDFDGNSATFKLNFDLGPAGKFVFEFNAKKDMSDAGVKVFLNDKDLFTTKLKGVLAKAPRQFKYEVRYSGVYVGEGKMRIAYERFKELKFQYLPKTGATFDFVLEVTGDRTLNLHTTGTYNNEKNFEVKAKMSPLNDGNNVGFNSKVDWFMKDRSPFYRFFYNMNCLQCLTSFKVESNLSMMKSKLYKFEFDLTNFKEDGSSQKEVYITTKDRYYAFFSKYFLNELAHMFNYYQRFYKDFEVEGQWNPGKFLKVTSNREWFQSLMIENMDGYMRKVEFNGKELMRAGFNKNGRQIKQTIELPGGEKVDTKLSWTTDNFWNNKAQMSFDGPRNNKVNTEFEWDFNNAKKTMKLKAEGDNEFLGNFKVTRDYEYEVKHGVQHMKSRGLTNLPNSPLPADMETEIEVEYDTPYDFMFGQYVLLGGSKYGFQYDYKGFKWFF